MQPNSSPAKKTQAHRGGKRSKTHLFAFYYESSGSGLRRISHRQCQHERRAVFQSFATLVNIGIATDTPQGLFVPVIKDVRSKNIIELAHEIADITTRTRENRVQLHELQGGTFTITSVGNIGGRFATPIINHPEVAILGVNQIHDRPMVIDGEIVARKMMYLSPSFDHRVIDGAVAARFVSALKAILENPQQLLLELR